MANDRESAAKFQIFRAGDAPDAMAAGVMKTPVLTALQADRMKIIQGREGARASETRLLVDLPGFNLIYVWFKKNYPLPLHSHDADCLYYIIAGSLNLGTETLGPRDSFFVPAGAPYAYTPGPSGVELLEFRHARQVDFQLHAHGEAFWKRAAEAMAANSADWATARPPTLNA
jgi:hypothetical protein